MSETNVFLAVTDQDDGRGWSEERERERERMRVERARQKHDWLQTVPVPIHLLSTNKTICFGKQQQKHDWLQTDA